MELHPRKVAVIDDYIELIEERSEVALSHHATYIGNMQVAIGRWEQEHKAEQDKPDVVITCGTLVETMIYTALYALSNDRSMTEIEDKVANDGRAAMTIQYMGLLALDTIRYDRVYHLLPASDDKWYTQVEDHVPEAAEALDVRYTDLPTDPDDRVKTVLQEIAELETATPDEQASGDSTEAITVN